MIVEPVEPLQQMDFSRLRQYHARTLAARASAFAELLTLPCTHPQYGRLALVYSVLVRLVEDMESELLSRVHRN